MFNGLSGTLDWINNLIWLIVIFYLIFTGGIGFLIRLIAKPLKVDFNDIKTKKLDDLLLSLQLLRLYHGINVGSQSDRDLVSQAIRQDVLSSEDFRLLYFMPQIGKEKHSGFEFFMRIFVAVAVVFSVASVAYAAKGLKYDYSGFKENGERVLISEIYVYEPMTNTYFNKAKCKSLQPASKGIIKSACNYLINPDPDLKNELRLAIKQNNSTLMALLVTMSSILIVTIFLIAAYIQFASVNNKFINFKKSHIHK